jgi:AcrR family transcriptional regulator
MKALEAKNKRKEDVKLLILNAAKKLFLEKGFQATSVRNIATEIGYSPTTIYLYYKDKSDIVYDLHQEGFAILKNNLTTLSMVEAPFERLKALGRSYLNFAKENPDFYELMFVLKEPMQFLDNDSNEEIWEGGRQVFGFIVNTIKECQSEGYFYTKDPNYIALQAWGMVHGLCSLHITTRLQKIAQENFTSASSDELLEQAFKTYVEFIERTNSLKHDK